MSDRPCSICTDPVTGKAVFVNVAVFVVSVDVVKVCVNVAVLVGSVDVAKASVAVGWPDISVDWIGALVGVGGTNVTGGNAAVGVDP